MDTEKLFANGYLEIDNLDISIILSNLNSNFSIEVSELVPNKQPTGFTNTLTKVFGLKSFPFHTDGAHRLIPPRWTVLKYEGNYDSKSATLLYDSNLLSNLEEYDDFFFHEVYLVMGSAKPFLTTLINKQIHVEAIFRYNSLVMKKLYDRTKLFIDNLITTDQKRICWYPKKALIIDNWRMLHSREQVFIEEELTRKFTRYNLTPY